MEPGWAVGSEIEDPSTDVVKRLEGFFVGHQVLLLGQRKVLQAA